jgi:hypothetical protein
LNFLTPSATGERRAQGGESAGLAIASAPALRYTARGVEFDETVLKEAEPVATGRGPTDLVRRAAMLAAGPPTREF